MKLIRFLRDSLLCSSRLTLYFENIKLSDWKQRKRLLNNWNNDRELWVETMNQDNKGRQSQALGWADVMILLALISVIHPLPPHLSRFGNKREAGTLVKKQLIDQPFPNGPWFLWQASVLLYALQREWDCRWEIIWMSFGLLEQIGKDCNSWDNRSKKRLRPRQKSRLYHRG